MMRIVVFLILAALGALALTRLYVIMAPHVDSWSTWLLSGLSVLVYYAGVAAVLWPEKRILTKGVIVAVWVSVALLTYVLFLRG